MMAVLGVVIWRDDPGLLHASWKPDFEAYPEAAARGDSRGGADGLETAVFATVTVLIGKLSATALAGHQIALTTVSMTFMMPLGISSAAAVRVGQAIGRGDPDGAARSGWTALGLGGASCRSRR